MGAERPLGYDPLLGQGRDAQDPFYEAIKDEGDIGVPLDVRALGFWLKGLFGAANASIGVIVQGETETTSTIDTSPASFPLKRFSQGSGTIRVGGGQLANVVGGKLSFSNNLERVETIRADGLIDGVAHQTGERLGGFWTNPVALDQELPAVLLFLPHLV